MESGKINWKNQSVELLVVFIGITLAFALNNWREYNKDRELEHQYIKSFHDELAFTKTTLDSVIIENKTTVERIKAMLPLMKNGNMPMDSILVAIMLTADVNLFIENTYTYETIKNSGSFNIIQSFKVRSKIIEYYETYKSKELVERYFQMYIDNYTIPFIIKNMDLMNGKIMTKINGYEINNLINGYYQLLAQVVNNYQKLSNLNKLTNELLEKGYTFITKSPD